MSVTYEWDCETVADGDSSAYEDGEVIEHAHGATYKEVLAWAARNPPEPGFRNRLVLVRDDDEGRSWAYVEDGKLPEYFTDADGADAAKVPNKFVRQVSAQSTCHKCNGNSVTHSELCPQHSVSGEAAALDAWRKGLELQR